MSDPLASAITAAGSGLAAQAKRLAVVSQNIANAQSTSRVAGGAPYQRQTITFSDTLDRATGTTIVDVGRIRADASDFALVHDPANPAADARGMVRMPNVNMIVEMADMREANRSYEANLQVMAQVRDMMTSTIDMMRGR